MSLGCFVHDIDNMPAGEYEDWKRFYLIEPFGYPRAEARFGILAANSLASSQNKFRDKNVYSPSHWTYNGPVKPLSADESLAIMKASIPTAKIRRRKPIGD